MSPVGCKREILMIEVVLDTSVYRNDPWRKKADFVALSGLLQSGKIRLHVPYFVRFELTTYLSQEYFLKHLNEIQKAIEKIKRNLATNNSGVMGDFEEKFQEIRNYIEKYSDTEFEKWLSDNHAIVHEVSKSHGENVARDYFEGNLPFREVKKRDDFPDAFIWHSIIDLLNNVTELYFVVGDNGLRRACDSMESVFSYSSLSEFLSSDVCTPLLVDEKIEENVQNFIKFLPNRGDLILNYFMAQIDDKLYGEEIESSWIPDDNNIAMFTGIENFDSMDIKYESAQYYGGGLVVIPFQMSIHSHLNYSIFIPDYYLLGEKRTEHISTTILNKHYYEAEETYPVEIEGNIAIVIDVSGFEEKKLLENDFDFLLDEAIVKIDSFSTLEIPEDVWRNWD